MSDKKIDIDIFSSMKIENKSASLVKMDDCIRNNEPSSYIPSGTFTLDWITGRPGIRKAAIYSLIGDTGSLKSYLAGEFIRSITLYNQNKFNEPGVILLNDSESSYTPDWFEERGIESSNVMTCLFESMEDMTLYYVDFFKKYRSAIKSRTDNLSVYEYHEKIPILGLVFDTISAICSEDDYKEKNQFASAARLMSKFVRIVQTTLIPANIIALFIFQERSQIKQSIYEKEDINKTARGIRPARFDAQAMYQLKIRQKSEHVRYCKIKAAKNRLNSFNEGKECQLVVDLRDGINDIPVILEAAVDIGIVKKIGNNYVFPDSKEKIDPATTANRVWDEVKREVFGENYNPYIYTNRTLDMKIDNEPITDINEVEEDDISNVDELL